MVVPRVNREKLWANLSGVSQEAMRRRLQGDRFTQWDPEEGGDAERESGMLRW